MAYKLFDLGDCEEDVLGTGILSCDLTAMGDLKSDILFKKGWFSAITNGSVGFDLAEYIIEVKKLNALPLKDLKEFTQDTPENENNTDSRGVIQEVRLGKPQFSFQYTKGRCFQKTLFNKRGQGRWDHGLVFENGVLMAINADGTKLKGFDGGMFSVETYKLLQGTDLESSMAKIQLLDATEFNARMVFIPFDTAGAIGEVNGVVETAITVDAVATGTSVEASITSSCNVGDSILDLDNVANYVLLGTQASATTISAVSYNATTGKYVFTLDVAVIATDTIQIKLNDGTYNVVEDSVGNLYKGTSNTVIVA